MPDGLFVGYGESPLPHLGFSVSGVCWCAGDANFIFMDERYGLVEGNSGTLYSSIAIWDSMSEIACPRTCIEEHCYSEFDVRNSRFKNHDIEEYVSRSITVSLLVKNRHLRTCIWGHDVLEYYSMGFSVKNRMSKNMYPATNISNTGSANTTPGPRNNQEDRVQKRQHKDQTPVQRSSSTNTTSRTPQILTPPSYPDWYSLMGHEPLFCVSSATNMKGFFLYMSCHPTAS